MKTTKILSIILITMFAINLLINGIELINGFNASIFNACCGWGSAIIVAITPK